MIIGPNAISWPNEIIGSNVLVMPNETIGSNMMIGPLNVVIGKNHTIVEYNTRAVIDCSMT